MCSIVTYSIKKRKKIYEEGGATLGWDTSPQPLVGVKADCPGKGFGDFGSGVAEGMFDSGGMTFGLGRCACR